MQTMATTTIEICGLSAVNGRAGELIFERTPTLRYDLCGHFDVAHLVLVAELYSISTLCMVEYF